MNCNCLTKTSTASLYRNGQLITQASANFIVCDCNDISDDISMQLGYNRCGNILRICSFVKNNGEYINNAILRVRVCCQNNYCYRNRCCNYCSCNCCENNCRCKEYNLCNLYQGTTRQICFNLNRCCCNCYKIEAELIVDNQVVARECLTV